MNVKGLILAGSADFKNELSKSDLFDNRLQAKVIKIVDISYGGENGFNQAIELSAETLANVKFVQEKKLLEAYFEEISQDTGKFCYGIEDTLKALDLGSCEKIIVYENLNTIRYTLKDIEGEEVVAHVNPELPDKSWQLDKRQEQKWKLSRKNHSWNGWLKTIKITVLN